jgi:hypothetical protein
VKNSQIPFFSVKTAMLAVEGMAISVCGRKIERSTQFKVTSISLAAIYKTSFWMFFAEKLVSELSQMARFRGFTDTAQVNDPHFSLTPSLCG